MDTNKDLTLEGNATCPTIGYQAVNVNVPVTVTPFAQTGATITRCCGTPIIKAGKAIGQGTKNGICNFTLGQNIVVAIPVAFGADATVGDTYVECLGSSSEEIDCEIISQIVDPEQPIVVPPTPTPTPTPVDGETQN